MLISNSRVSCVLKPAKFGLQLKNVKKLFQVRNLIKKKQELKGRATTAQIQTIFDQPKIDDAVDVHNIMRGRDAKGGSVVVVGGGPAGLAAALMFAKNGYNNITILEVLSEDEYFDSSKSYPYGIKYRGQTCLQKLDVLERLQEVGIDKGKVEQVEVFPNGTIKTISPIFFRPKGQTSLLTQRPEITQILFDKIQNEYKNSIKFHFNAKCIEFKQENQQLSLIYQIKGEDPIQISPYLVIGADGKNSFIRKSLHEITNQKKFKLIQKPVIGTGEIAKIIKVPHNFYLDKNKQIQAKTEILYQIFDANSDEKNKMFMMSYCLSQNSTKKQSRTFYTIFNNQNHQLLKINDTEEFFNVFEKLLPQLPIRDIITPEEADNFISKRAVKFPLGGYSQNLSYIIQEEKNNDNIIYDEKYNKKNSNDKKNNNKTIENNKKIYDEKNNNCLSKGVILIGDAIHHFPPTFGMGINAALEDVSVLYDLFQKYDCNIESIMHEYESTRIYDTKALLLLIRSDVYSKYGFKVKTFLHKKFPLIFPPPPHTCLQRDDLRYIEVLKNTTSSNYQYNLYVFILLNVVLFGVLNLHHLQFVG